jgi:hypothetical protein
MEGGIGFGLGAILKSEITLDQGRVVQDNFDGYEVLTIDEMPQVEVHIMPSTESPTGVGQPGVPPIGPAVATRSTPPPGCGCGCCRSAGRTGRRPDWRRLSSLRLARAHLGPEKERSPVGIQTSALPPRHPNISTIG